VLSYQSPFEHIIKNHPIHLEQTLSTPPILLIFQDLSSLKIQKNI